MWTEEKLKSRQAPVVILVAGEGRRLQELGKELPKALVPISRQPALGYVINYWQQFAREFIFVVGYKQELIIKFVQDFYPALATRFVPQDRPAGIAQAIACVRDYIREDFIVVLGDCLCRGKFVFPSVFAQGVGVWRTENPEAIRQSYSVEITGDWIQRVVEKPEELPNDLCGMGFYFFSEKVFDYIKITPVSSLRNEVEITDVIQKMIEGGEKICPLFFQGQYLNITSPADVLLAEKIFGEG